MKGIYQVEQLQKFSSWSTKIYYSKLFRLPLWLLRRAYFRNAPASQTHQVKMRLGHKLLIKPNQDYLKRVLFTRQYHDDNIHFVEQFIRPGAIILDIGANVGLYSCAYAQKYQSSNITIHAIEALANNFKALQININLNHFTNIKPYHLAVGKEDGQLEMTITDQDFVGNVVGDNISGHTKTGIKCHVPMVSLDDWTKKQNINQCDFIKIDIEGAEYYAFLGGENFLQTTRPVVQTEYNYFWSQKIGFSLTDYFDFFKRLNYKAFIEDKNTYRELSSLEISKYNSQLVDLVFVPSEKLKTSRKSL